MRSSLQKKTPLVFEVTIYENILFKRHLAAHRRRLRL